MIVEVLFSEVCNLFGDGKNSEYLRMSLPDAEFHYTGLNDTPFFAENTPDIILLGSMTENIQRRVIEKLRPLKDRITALADGGTVFLATGNAGEIFCKKISYITEEKETQGLGLFDLTVKTDLFNRYNGKVLGKTSDGLTVIGHRSQFSFVYGDNSACAFLSVERGCGINPDSKFEGWRRNNLICTHLLGAILPCNPLFTEYLISLAGGNQKAAFRDAALDAYNRRLKEFSAPETKF